MHKQSFEEQMQQLMQGFDEQPEEFVWENIEQAIKKKEKKRRYILWWILPVCIAGIGYFLLSENKNITDKNIVENNKSTINKTPEQTSKETNGKNSESNIISKQTKNISETTIKEYNKTKTIKQIAQKNAAITIYRENKKDNSSIKVKKETTFNTEPDQRNNIGTNSDDLNETNISKEENAITKTEIKNSKTIKDTAIKKSSNDSSNIAKDKHKKSTRKNIWILGVTAGYGFMHEKVKSATYTSYENGFSNSGSTAGQGPAQIINSYTINAASAYNIGISASKSFAKKYSIETGISYNYMRSQYNTTSLNTSSFSRTENKTINRYHALEIPLMLERNLFNKNNIGVGLRAGINNSFIINATSITNNQRNKTENINKYQASIGYGLKLNFKINKANVFILPSLQHSITNLTANNSHKWTRGSVNIGYYFR